MTAVEAHISACAIIDACLTPSRGLSQLTRSRRRRSKRRNNRKACGNEASTYKDITLGEVNQADWRTVAEHASVYTSTSARRRPILEGLHQFEGRNERRAQKDEVPDCCSFRLQLMHDTAPGSQSSGGGRLDLEAKKRAQHRGDMEGGMC